MLSIDETRCLTLLACAQAGEDHGSDRLATALVGHDGAPALRAAALQLARILGRAGYRLSVPAAHGRVLH